MINFLQSELPTLVKKIGRRPLTDSAASHLQQLNHHMLTSLINESIQISKQTVLTYDILLSTVRKKFSGVLCENIIQEGSQYKSMTTDELNQHFTFSVDSIKKYIRKHTPIKYTISYLYNVYITAILEYITAEIIELAYVQSIKTNQYEITHRNVFSAIHYDKELLLMCESFRIQLIGSGLPPRHLDSDNDSSVNLPKKQFEWMTRHLLRSHDKKELSKKSTLFLQYYLESFISKVLIKTDQLCTQFDKDEIRSQDLTYVYSLL